MLLSMSVLMRGPMWDIDLRSKLLVQHFIMRPPASESACSSDSC